MKKHMMSRAQGTKEENGASEGIAADEALWLCVHSLGVQGMFLTRRRERMPMAALEERNGMMCVSSCHSDCVTSTDCGGQAGRPARGCQGHPGKR